MARATSWNWELEIPAGVDSGGGSVFPVSIGEFGEGEEGRIEVADGDRKYKIRDQIFNIDEIETSILVRKDWNEPGSEFRIMQDWCQSGEVKDVILTARGAGRDPDRQIELQYILLNCELAMGKHSAFDRKSKTEDTKKFFLIPDEVEEYTGG